MKFALAPSRIHMRSCAHWQYLPVPQVAARPQAASVGQSCCRTKNECTLASNESATPMALDAKIIVTPIAHAARKRAALIVRHVRRLIEARRRRVTCEQEFYRAYEASCRANNLRPVWAEDWRAGGWRQR